MQSLGHQRTRSGTENMKPPLIVEITRGERVESHHQVDVVVTDASGSVVSAWGEPERPIFPRSAIKGLQALPLIESGAADAYGFEPHHLSLACSSHHAEPMHVKAAGEMLDQAGLDANCLECGAQPPFDLEEVRELARKDVDAGQIHNTCSGKHSGFLAVAGHQHMNTSGYVRIDHPLQKEIAGALENVTGVPHRSENHAIDGCSIPTYAIPLKNLSTAFAKFGVGEGGTSLRSSAMLRLRDACLMHPEMVSGTTGACTKLMQALGNRAFAKYGAEGVYIASLPEHGYGIALKVRDGAPRAAEVAIANIVENLLELDDAEAIRLKNLTKPILTSRSGIVVGEARVSKLP